MQCKRGCLKKVLVTPKIFPKSVLQRNYDLVFTNTQYIVIMTIYCLADINIMKIIITTLFSFFLLVCTHTQAKSENALLGRTDLPKFSIKQDLLLLNYDLKTDVDDVHTVAAAYSIFKSERFRNVKRLAVSGTYGVQAGLYVRADSLFNLVYGVTWLDAHQSRLMSLRRTVDVIETTLSTKGRVWVAEAGQSDFTDDVIVELKRRNMDFNRSDIVVVQHSEWNEGETSKMALGRVKSEATYVKIPDGNQAGNGSPGFNEATYKISDLMARDGLMGKVWLAANEISKKYNGVDGRYLNKTIDEGGLDFSDLSEVVWILNIEGVESPNRFFEVFSSQ